jgi:hypothetical protein
MEPPPKDGMREALRELVIIAALAIGMAALIIVVIAAFAG